MSENTQTGSPSGRDVLVRKGSRIIETLYILRTRGVDYSSSNKESLLRVLSCRTTTLGNQDGQVKS